MSVKLSFGGAGAFKDHNELANKGVRPHVEIDAYMDELDEARSSYPSIHNRINAIEQTAGDASQGLTEAKAELLDIQAKLDELEEQLEQGVPGSGQEVIAARTDGSNRTFSSLKERLDYMQQLGGGGNGGQAGGIALGYEASLPGTRPDVQRQFSVPSHPAGSLIAYVDGIHSPRTEFTDSGTEVVFGYDIPAESHVEFILFGGSASGNPPEETDTEYEYAADGSVIRETVKTVSGAILQTIDYDYYPDGAVKTETLTKNGSVFVKTYFYSNGRVTKIQQRKA
ncbi:hypothetical protein [Paenibacillus sp. NPDC058071]|uniref:hypothetical protein n=1 Tax=Paenibacillus sp. NPDC058071 TaxID=3346326 RepID=UPI0036DC6333